MGQDSRFWLQIKGVQLRALDAGVMAQFKAQGLG